MKVQKISSIEGLRGLACFMVILSHLSLMLLPYLHGENPKQIAGWFDEFVYSLPVGFIYSGTSAVYIFFALSGYVLSYACLNKGDALNNCANMAVRRYIRLCIPVMASVAICYVAFSYTSDQSASLPWINHYGKNVDMSFPGAIYNGLFGSLFIGDNRYNWVTWTMKIEFYGSLLVFGTLPIVNKMKYKAVISMFIGVIFALCYPGKDGYGYAAFYFGMAIYFSREIKLPVVALFVFLVGLYFAGYHYRQPSYSVITSYMTFDMPGGKILHYYFFNMVSGVLIVYACLKSTALSILTSNKISVWLGKMSFSAYLLQMPVYYILTTRTYNAFQESGFGFTVSASISALITIVAIYLLSYVFWWAVDSKSIAISKYGLNLIENPDVKIYSNTSKA